MNPFTIYHCWLYFFLVIIPSLSFAQSVETLAEWPTLHGNLQRHGFYPYFPHGDLTVVWRKELYHELTAPRAEIIVGNHMAYMGTYAGNMYAWNAATGEEVWVFHTNNPIGHSPMYHDGILFFGAMDGCLYAIEAESGNECWRFQAEEGIWVSPLVHHQQVYFGCRSGMFYALDAYSGRPRWTFQTDGPILTTASLASDDRRLLFASEDMHVYCIDAESGDLLWKSRKLHGLSIRDYFPVVVKDKVFITTNPVKDFHTILGENQNMLLALAEFEGGDDRYIPGSPVDIRLEQEKIIQFLCENPSEQTFYAFNLEDGREPWIAPLLYTGGLHNPMTPPAYNPIRDEVYVFVRSAYGVWDGGGEVRPYTGVGRLDLKSGLVNLIEHGHRSKDSNRPPGRKDMPWMSFNTIGDETQTLASSPDFLLSIHQGFIGSMNFETGLCQNLFGKRDTYGGFYGPGNFGWEKDGGLLKAKEAGEPYGIVNEWHGPARSIVSAAGSLVFYHVGSQVLCLGEKK